PGAGAAALRRANGPPRLRHRRARARADPGAATGVPLRPGRRHARSRRRRRARARRPAPRRADRSRAGAVVTALARLAVAGLVRTPGRTVLRTLTLAAAVALLGAMLLTPRRGARPQRFRVSGIALVTAPDVLFQPLNPLLGPAPAQPPADIAILQLDTFARTVAPALQTITPANPGAASVPGTQV